MVHEATAGIWTFSGPAGSGKTTLVNSVLNMYCHARPLRRIVTRPKRPTDSHLEYLHVSCKVFKSLQSANVLLWPVEIHGHMNGIFKTDVARAIKGDQLTTVDMAVFNIENLARYAREASPSLRVRSIFLCIEDEEEQARRLAERGEQEITERIAFDKQWLVDARKSFVPFHFIDALQPKEKVLEDALAHLTSP